MQKVTMGNLRGFDSAIINAPPYLTVAPTEIFKHKPSGTKAFILAPTQRDARLFAEYAGFTDYVYVRDVYMLYGQVGNALFIVDAENVHNLYGVLSYAQMRDFYVQFYGAGRS